MDTKKILFITQEIYPYLPSNLPADFSKLIPEGVQDAGFDLRVFAPRFGVINERRNQLHDVIRLSGINIIVNDTDHPLLIKVASLADSRLQVYFVDNDEFFKRKSRYEADPKIANTNADRSVFFIRGVLEAIKKLRWVPDIVHCIGWFTGFAPLYLKSFYKNDPCFGKAKVFFSTAREEEVGPLGDNVNEICAFDKIPAKMLHPLKDCLTAEGLQRLGIAHADGISLIAASEEGVKELANYAKSLEKPLIIGMPNEENCGERFSTFYRSLLQ